MWNSISLNKHIDSKKELTTNIFSSFYAKKLKKENETIFQRTISKRSARWKPRSTLQSTQVSFLSVPPFAPSYRYFLRKS